MTGQTGTAYLIELRGVYDGWSVRVLKDGTRINRWIDPVTGAATPGYERRAAITEAFLAGEPSNGRWY